MVWFIVLIALVLVGYLALTWLGLGPGRTTTLYMRVNPRTGWVHFIEEGDADVPLDEWLETLDEREAGVRG